MKNDVMIMNGGF